MSDIKKPKILLVSVSAGAGHVRAATALQKTAEQYFPEFEVRHVDMIDFVSWTLRRALVDTYDFLVKAAPKVWGYVYKKANSRKNLNRVYTVTGTFRKWSVRKFYHLLQEYKPDLVLCTHSFPAQVIRRSGLPLADIPLGVVVTDYALHEFWLVPEVNYYFVACPEVKKALQGHGVRDSHIFVTGIPVDPVFFEKKEVQKLQEKYGMRRGDKGVLLLSGGHGMIRTDEIVNELVKTWKGNERLQIVAIAGKNRKLWKKLKQLEKSANEKVKVKVVGWTESMDEYMRLADVVVTKSGGLTTTECLTLKKYMLVVRPIPGQEEENAIFIAKNNGGEKVLNENEVAEALQRFFQKEREACWTLTPENSAEKIWQIIKNIPT